MHYFRFNNKQQTWSFYFTLQITKSVSKRFCNIFWLLRNNPGINLKGKPILLVVLGDFNAKLSQWHGRDSSVLKEFQLKVSHRITSLPTNILHYSSSCIDLIFTSQLNLSVEPRTLPSLHQNCHHQIIYTKCNLEVLYLAAVTPARFGTIKFNCQFIRWSINEFDWVRAFDNKHADKKSFYFQ